MVHDIIVLISKWYKSWYIIIIISLFMETKKHNFTYDLEISNDHVCMYKWNRKDYKSEMLH